MKNTTRKTLLQLHKDLAALEAAGVPGAAEGRRKVWQLIQKGESQ